MIDDKFSRNNLATAASPYLRQHQDNPVWWQQWSAEVLEFAATAGKPVLVSVGYSTCHWCHVMAAEAFSDPDCAAALNADFVCVKVDREERPDIDQLMMGFLVGTTGQGGWPLNVFMSPKLEPFYALTYAGTEPRFGRPGFPEILKRVLAFYRENSQSLTPFVLPGYSESGGENEVDAEERENTEAGKAKSFSVSNFSRIDQTLSRNLHGLATGSASGPRFPPHASLLYALYRIEAEASLPQAVTSVLDRMQQGGLHDHVGGGFFRYCVDSQWTIPHFEKMLYDQALCLWNYSVAARRFGRKDYRRTAEGIIHSLQDNFLQDGLFNAALDADTDHEEGSTYLWTLEDIQAHLDPRQAEAVLAAFDISTSGNFEGKNHLVRRTSSEGYLNTGTSAGSGKSASSGKSGSSEIMADPETLNAALAALLAARKQRPQPFTDRKKLSSWNALTGVALVQASRHIRQSRAGDLARLQLDALLALHWDKGRLVHGSLDGRLFGGSFLGDHAAFLLLLATHHEDRRIFKSEILATRDTLMAFKSGKAWMESWEKDFLPVPAESFDSPVPSSIALAEAALTKTAMVLGEDYKQLGPGRPGAEDFRNFAALMGSGLWYVVSGPQASPWLDLPVPTVQGEGPRLQYCYSGQCTSGLPSSGKD